MTDDKGAQDDIHHVGGNLGLMCPNHQNEFVIVGVLVQVSPLPGTGIDYARPGKPTVSWPLDDTGRFLDECPTCGKRVGDLVSSIETKMNEVAANPAVTQDVYYLILNFNPHTGLRA